MHACSFELMENIFVSRATEGLGRSLAATRILDFFGSVADVRLLSQVRTACLRVLVLNCGAMLAACASWPVLMQALRLAAR
jgi:hypothetical protein